MTGCPGGPSPRPSPRPPGGLLCPGRGVQSWTSHPSGCPVPEEQQGWSLRTPRASPTQRMQSRAPRAPGPLQSGGGTRGGERSGAQGTEAVGWARAGIFCTHSTPAQGTAVSPGAWGCQGPLAVPPVSGRGGLPCTPPMKLPQTQKVCPGDETSPAKASCASPAGHTRPGDTAPTLAHAFELHTLCSWTQSIAPRSAAGRWQGLQRAPGLLGVEALLCARTPALGVGSSSPGQRNSRHLPGRQPHPGSITEGQVLTE